MNKNFKLIYIYKIKSLNSLCSALSLSPEVLPLYNDHFLKRPPVSELEELKLESKLGLELP